MEELKRRGFTDPTMRDWTFENDNGRNPQTGLARRYVEPVSYTHLDVYKRQAPACAGFTYVGKSNVG